MVLIALISVSVLAVILVLCLLYLIKDNRRLKNELSSVADKAGIDHPNGNTDKLGKYYEPKALGEASNPKLQLTARERQIADLCCEGLTTRKIGEKLNLSPRTVEVHKNNIFRKLEISSTLELVLIMKGGKRK